MEVAESATINSNAMLSFSPLPDGNIRYWSRKEMCNKYWSTAFERLCGYLGYLNMIHHNNMSV